VSDFTLYRPPPGETAEDVDLFPQGPSSRPPAPLGPLPEIKERLIASGRFRENPVADRANDMALRWLRHEGAEVSEAAWHHAAVRDVKTDAELSLFGDPVATIHLDRGAPSDFLAIIEVLADLGPFVVWERDSDRLLDPKEL
jgi:hypothetical protein